MREECDAWSMLEHAGVCIDGAHMCAHRVSPSVHACAHAC
jgi:hypothetical protein